jgi:hypothetical protein
MVRRTSLWARAMIVFLWRELNDLVMRPQAPWRPEFRARGGENEERRLRAERLHESNRGRVEPLQILKDKPDGRRPRKGRSRPAWRYLPGAQRC